MQYYARARYGTLKERQPARAVTTNRARFPVTIAVGPHPFPSRTRKLRPPAPMVLGGQPPGRVGRRRDNRCRGPCHGGGTGLLRGGESQLGARVCWLGDGRQKIAGEEGSGRRLSVFARLRPEQRARRKRQRAAPSFPQRVVLRSTKTGYDSRRGTGARLGRGDGAKPGAWSQGREGAPGARVNSRTAKTAGDGYRSRAGSGRSPASGRWDDRGSSRRSSQSGNAGDARFGSRQGRPESASDRRGEAGASRVRNDNRTAPVRNGGRDVDRRGGYSGAADPRPRSYGRPQRAPAFGPPTGHSSARTQPSAPSSGARGSGGRPWASTGSPRSREPGPQWGRSHAPSGGGARPPGVPARSFDGDSRGTGARSAPRSYGRQAGAYQSRDAGSWPRDSYTGRASDGRTADRAPYTSGRTSDGRTGDRAPYTSVGDTSGRDQRRSDRR